MRKSDFAIWMLVLLAFVAAGTSMINATRSQSATAANSEIYRHLDLFGDVLERVRTDYVEAPDDSQLIESAINGMLSGLDPHSTYLNPKHFRDMQVQTRGEFGGLGIEVTMEEGVVKVVSPIENTPADKAGVLSGDLITHLDGVSIQGLTLEQAVEKMRGPVNTPIVITVLRKSTEPFDIKINRDVIRINPVRANAEGDDIAYIRVKAFSEQTYDELKDCDPEAQDRARSEAERLHRRSAQQSRRPSRSGHLGFGCVPRQGRDRADARPQSERDAALECPSGRSDRSAENNCADQWRLGFGVGNRGRRSAGS